MESWGDYDEDEEKELHPEVFPPGPNACHGVVGLAPGLGIQTDSIQNPLSLIVHADNLRQFLKDGGKPNVNLYSSRVGSRYYRQFV